MANVYKSKKGIMPLGILLIAITVGITGCLLSFVYLKINQVCPSIYLCILIALLFGCAMGGAAYLLIHFLKIRSKATAFIGVLIGCLIFTVFKWALYVQWDNENIFKNFPSAWEYCEFNYDFSLDGTTASEPLNKEQIKIMVSLLKEISAHEYLVTTSGNTSSPKDYIKTLKETTGRNVTIDELKKTNSFDFFYKRYVIKGRETENILAAYDMKTDEYLKYIKRYPDVKYLITHPADFIDNIIYINGYGRWSIGSNSTNSAKSNNVKGWALWIVWLAECFVICVPAFLIACGKAEKPFIESTTSWAKLTSSDGFMFKAPNVPSVAGPSFKTTPESLFMYPHILTRPGNAPFLKLEFYHSINYDENYANLILMTFVPKNKEYQKKIIAKYVAVDKEFIYNLYQHCGQDVPFTYQTSAQSNPTIPNVIVNPDDIFNAKLSDVMKIADNNTMDSISTSLEDEKSENDIYNELNS